MADVVGERVNARVSPLLSLKWRPPSEHQCCILQLKAARIMGHARTLLVPNNTAADPELRAGSAGSAESSAANDARCLCHPAA